MPPRLPAILLLGALLTSGRPAAPAAVPEPLPAAAEVIRKFIERAANEATRPERGPHVFFRTNLTEEFNRKGRVTAREEFLLRVTVVDGEPTAELLAVNGRPATESDRQRERRRFGGRREDTTRRERPDRARTMNAYFTREVLDRYDFAVQGCELVGDRWCYRLTFRPRAREHHSEQLFERVLDALTGVLWIDREDHQLAKADITLGEKVSFWGGVLGGLEHLSLVIERTREPHGVWRDRVVEARFIGRAVARQINVRTVDHSSAPEPLPATPAVAAE